MLPCPPRNLQQNIKPLRWLAETAENKFIPTSHVQNLTELTRNLCNARLLSQFKVEAADATPIAFEAEKAAVRAPISYV
jgi:hypothetical protein